MGTPGTEGLPGKHGQVVRVQTILKTKQLSLRIAQEI